MLLEFTVGNFLSFKDKKTLDFSTSSISDFPNNVYTEGGYKFLKSIVIYGANASGKSNLLKAMNVMRQMVTGTAQQSSTSILSILPFLLNKKSMENPSHFEALFLIEGVRYRYGFEATHEKITSEWLFEAKKNTEKPLFIRIPEGIDVMPRFKEGRNIEQRTRDNALFLSIVDQFNGEVAHKVMHWFNNWRIVSGLSHTEQRQVTYKYLKTPSKANVLKNFFMLFDLGFYNIRLGERLLSQNDILGLMINEKSTEYKPTFIREPVLDAYTIHNQYDDLGAIVGSIEFNMEILESSGTNKLFDITGSILEALEAGSPLIIDELDAKLHPLITLSLIRLFHNPEYNPNNAQLIFATHDTNLLSMGRFRRDQIYFTEKNAVEATELYSLVEFKLKGTVRKDRSFEKDYIQGLYGAIPHVAHPYKLAEAWQGK